MSSQKVREVSLWSICSQFKATMLRFFLDWWLVWNIIMNININIMMRTHDPLMTWQNPRRMTSVTTSLQKLCVLWNSCEMLDLVYHRGALVSTPFQLWDSATCILLWRNLNFWLRHSISWFSFSLCLRLIWGRRSSSLWIWN